MPPYLLMLNMRPIYALLILSLHFLGTHAFLQIPGLETDYDAVVVGGGPAGIAALSALGRIRRRALLIDSAEYRNSPTAYMHDVAGFDGVRPAYFRWSACKATSHYTTVDSINGTVTEVKPRKNNTFFSIQYRDFGGRSHTKSARKVILGTGLKEILPETPRIRQYFGRGIYWCPWCDGLEHADQALGVLGPMDRAFEAAAEVLTLNQDLVIYANGTDTPENRKAGGESFAENASEYLEARNVRVDNRTITGIERLRPDDDSEHIDPSLPSVPKHDLFRIDFEDGSSSKREAFFVNYGCEQRSRIGVMAGVKLKEGMMLIDESMRTSVPGIYAVGDANSDPRTNVLHALHSGKQAAVHLHVELEREYSRWLGGNGLSIVRGQELSK